MDTGPQLVKTRSKETNLELHGSGPEMEGAGAWSVAVEMESGGWIQEQNGSGINMSQFHLQSLSSATAQDRL